MPLHVDNVAFQFCTALLLDPGGVCFPIPLWPPLYSKDHCIQLEIYQFWIKEVIQGH